MKKTLAFIMIFLIAISSTITAFASDLSININLNDIDENNASYGINLDNEISSLDGVLSSNLVENGSFENKDTGWVFPSVEYTYGNTDVMNENNKSYNVITVNSSYLLQNNGYSKDGGMGFIENEKYDFSCYAKNIDFDGTIKIWLESEVNKNEILQLSTASLSNSKWEKLSVTLNASKTESGKLSILFEGNGTIELDSVELIPQNSYGYDSDEWKNSSIKNESFTAIKNLNPTFIRYSLNGINWQNTLGETCFREQTSYSNEFGFHEFLQLCSDLNTKAIPCISSGDYDIDSNEFANLKQGVLNMIEYANADWETSYYGSIRSSNGGVEPFNIEAIQLTDDGAKLDELKSAIKESYPDIEILEQDDINFIKTNNEGTLEDAINNSKDMIKSNGLTAFDVMFSRNAKSLALINPSGITYTPSYYAQMLFANNIADKSILTSLNDEEITQTVDVDKNNHITYIKLINTGSSKSISVNINGASELNTASIQSISNSSLTVKNEADTQYIAPTSEEIKIKGGAIEVKLDKNSISVVRISFDGNDGSNIFNLPDDIDYETKGYVSSDLIIMLIAVGVAIPIGTVIGFILYKKVLSKKKARKNDD